MKSFWRDYSLSLVLLCLFLASWGAHAYYEWLQEEETANLHGESVDFRDYTNAFLSSTFENWQSEFLQLLTMVVLTSFLIHKGSSESRDGQDKIEMKLTHIEKMLSRSASRK